jgi:hypothetical protein
MTAPAPPLPPGQGPSDYEGAGLLSSIDDLNTAGASGDGFQIAFAAAGVALDALGFVADPFDALVSAGVGWAFEHMPILSELLDRLAGNPWQIKAEAKSWHEVALGLTAAAVTQRDLAGVRSTGWTGEAGETYRRAAGTRAELTAGIAADADRFAILLVNTGAAVGTLRSIVRDLIADLVAEVVAWAVGALVTAYVTGGLSVAAAAGWIIFRVVDLANDIVRRIADLLQTLADAGHAASGLAQGMLDAARRTAYVAGILNAGAGPVDEFIQDGTAIPQLVELGKQTTTADLEDPKPGS